MPLQIRDPEACFQAAILAGVLSNDEEAPNWTGNYMYMSSSTFQTGGEPGPSGIIWVDVQYWWRDGFKHRDTRRYLVNLTPRV